MRVGPAMLIVGLAVLVVAAVGSSFADADTIDCGAPGASSSSDAWNRADAVFTGYASEPRNPGFLMFRDRRTSVVDVQVHRVLLGEAPTELTMFVSTCGPPLPTDRVVNVAVRRDDAGDYGLLDLLTDEQAASLGGTSPVADGAGPVRRLVSLDAGAFDLVALDGNGRALGFRVGSDPPRQVAACPDGRTAVAWGSDPSLPSPDDPSIEVIDLATMSTTGTLPLHRRGPVTFLACHEAAASRVTAFIETSPVGGSLVSIGPGSSTVTPTESRSPFGLDNRGNVVGWTNVFTSEVVVIDPTSGATVSKHLMPADLHGYVDQVTRVGQGSVHGAEIEGDLIDDDGRFAVVSPDGRSVAILAHENPTDTVPSPPLRLVTLDLSGATPPQVIALDGMEVPWRIDWVGSDVVLTYADGDRASGLASDAHIDARRVAVPVASSDESESAATGGGSIVADTRPVLEAAQDDSDPVAAATQVGLVPEVFGEPVRAIASIPASTEVVVEPAAAHPVLTQSSVAHGGRPFPAPVDHTWVWVVAVLGVFGVVIGAVWQQRRATRGRNDPWLRW